MTPILKVENLSKDFVKSLDLVAKGLNRIGQNYKEEIVHAVDNVNFSIFKGGKPLKRFCEVIRPRG